jgi:hypothetical protein
MCLMVYLSWGMLPWEITHRVENNVNIILWEYSNENQISGIRFHHHISSFAKLTRLLHSLKGSLAGSWPYEGSLLFGYGSQGIYNSGKTPTESLIEIAEFKERLDIT